MFYSTGVQVQYFHKKKEQIEVESKLENCGDIPEKFPSDVNVAFKGPDDTYYFIRKDNYCRRHLNGSDLGLDPPDYVRLKRFYFYPSFS